MSSSQYIINDVSKYYYINDEKHVVLNNVSLNISADDITVILGESGCGKTTLLRVIANLEEVSSGKIEFIKNNEKTKPKVGLVFQESRLMPWLDISENISFNEVKNKTILSGLKKLVLSQKKNDNNEKINEYLHIMKLDKFKNLYPNELSGGMAQRVSIARALYFDPDILLMDEPFSALDYFTRMEMQKELIRVHKTTHKGVVFVTHDIDEALKIAKKIIVFNKNHDIKEFQVNEDFDRDTENEYYLNLKKEILEILKNKENQK